MRVEAYYKMFSSLESKTEALPSSSAIISPALITSPSFLKIYNQIFSVLANTLAY